jgi:quaternary ammonium compound-resistance protein SugE
MAWLLLLIAAALEIVWAPAFKDGKLALGITTALGSIILLYLALRDLPVGTAYAAWTGIGAVGVAAVGIWLLDESADPARLACLGLIIAGVIGLRIVEG